MRPETTEPVGENFASQQNGQQMSLDSFQKIPARDDFCWPNDRRIAVVFNIAYEMWGADATSSVGPMGNVLADGTFDPNADSYGRYNAACGADRLLRMAARNGVRANVLTSAMIAQSQPGALKQIVAAGHEIVAHGLTQDQIMPILTREQRSLAIAQSTELLESAMLQRPQGWISPRVTSGLDTHRALAKHGYSWHGDALDADLPYLQRFPEGDILAIPMSIEFNDLPHAMRFGRTPRQFVEQFKDALDGLSRQPAETIILDVFAHGHCFGRPAAAWAIDEIMKRCAGQDRIWVTTRGEIHRYCQNRLLTGQPKLEAQS
jgi:peptidoglycan/xylan/chitin deacetylase (PgdA/CDA1 family)